MMRKLRNLKNCSAYRQKGKFEKQKRLVAISGQAFFVLTFDLFYVNRKPVFRKFQHVVDTSFHEAITTLFIFLRFYISFLAIN